MKSKSYIYLFNPEADYALAEFRNSYTPPARVVELRRALALDTLSFAGADDVIILLDPPAKALDPSSIDARVILPDQVRDFFQKITPECDNYEIRPWGWTPDLANRLKHWGCPQSLLPSSEYLSLVRKLSDRANTIEFNEILNNNLLNVNLQRHISELPVKFTDIEKAIDWIDTQDRPFLKYPWSSSGRGILCADNSISRNTLIKWISGGIRRQGHVMGETFFNKAIDFATEWEVSSGKATFLGVSLFEATEKGRYLKNLSGVQTELINQIRIIAPEFDNEFIKAQKMSLEVVAEDYTGFVGIDMMADDAGRIRGGVELNFRMTMGISTLLKQKKIKRCKNGAIN